MEYSIIRYTNHIAKLNEDRWDEPTPDFPNPLPVPPPAQLGDILDIIDEIELKYISKEFAAQHGEFNTKNARQWGQTAHQIRRQIGKVQDVPIHKLIAIEPKLYKDHLIKLTQGYTPTRGDKLPIVYILNSGMYIGDGNHRVVNELMNGKDRVNVIVIDFRKDEKELQTS